MNAQNEAWNWQIGYGIGNADGELNDIKNEAYKWSIQLLIRLLKFQSKGNLHRSQIFCDLCRSLQRVEDQLLVDEQLQSQGSCLTKSSFQKKTESS